MSEKNRRILVIDDNESIHEDFQKTLAGPSSASRSLVDTRTLLLGAEAAAETPAPYVIDSAFQGEEGYEKAAAALADGRPFALAFVDVRMPPGWDGIATVKRLFDADPYLQVVICTAFSDYSWERMIGVVGETDRLLILKKPFDPVEIRQLASALTEKWNQTARARGLVGELRTAEQQALALASSLETVNRALDTAKASAEKSSQLKTEFLVHLSNEVHSNLDSILDKARLLKGEGDPTPEQRELLDVIVEASHHLTTSLDQILDITEIESGRVAPRIVACSPLRLAHEVVDEWRPHATRKGLAIDVEVIGSIPETIQSDPARVRQILSNLVENAIRYTDEGSVRLLISRVQTSDWQHAVLRYDVSDSGCGIPARFLGSLFEPFFRLDEDRPGGTGLGLALSKRLVRILGAELSVESVVGHGSTFTLRLETGDLSGVRMIEGPPRAKII